MASAASLICRVALERRVVAAQQDAARARSLGQSRSTLDVLGQVHQHRPGPAGRAMWNASRMTRARSCTSLTRKLCLVTGAGDADDVGFLEGVVADAGAWRTCPVKATMGIESIRASCSAVTRLVAAGPEVTRHTPTFAGRARVALGRVAGRRLVADQDVAHPLEVVQRVVDRQHGAAGQAEDEVDAFALQTLEQNPRPWQSHGFLLGGPEMARQSTWGPRHGPQAPSARKRPGEPGALLGPACSAGH